MFDDLARWSSLYLRSLGWIRILIICKYEVDYAVVVGALCIATSLYLLYVSSSIQCSIC